MELAQAAPRRLRDRWHGREGTATAFASRRAAADCARRTRRWPSRFRRSTARMSATRAKMARSRITDALKGMPPYKTCIERSARAEVRPGEQGCACRRSPRIRASALARLCLLSAYGTLKASPDSIIAMANAIARASIRRACSRLSNARRRLQGEGRHETRRSSTICASSGRPEQHQSIAQSHRAGPREVRRAGQGAADHRHAAHGESGRSDDDQHEVAAPAARRPVQERPDHRRRVIKVDTARRVSIDSTRADRRGAEATAMPVAVQQWASRGAAEIPEGVRASRLLLAHELLTRLASCSRRSRAARRASQIEPKNPSAWLIIIVTVNATEQPDSALATAQQAIAAGRTEGFTLGRRLTAARGPALKKAQESKDARATGGGASRSRRRSTRLRRRPKTKFYIGFVSFQVGRTRFRTCRRSPRAGRRRTRRKGVRRGKVAEDMLAIVAGRDAAGRQVQARRPPARSWARCGVRASTSRR